MKQFAIVLLITFFVHYTILVRSLNFNSMVKRVLVNCSEGSTMKSHFCIVIGQFNPQVFKISCQFQIDVHCFLCFTFLNLDT